MAKNKELALEGIKSGCNIKDVDKSLRKDKDIIKELKNNNEKLLKNKESLEKKINDIEELCNELSERNIKRKNKYSNGQETYKNPFEIIELERGE